MVLGIHHFKKTPPKKHYLYVDQSHPTRWPRYSKGYSRRAAKFRKFGRNRFLDSFLFWLCLIGLTVTSSSRSSCSYENGHKWMFPLPQKTNLFKYSRLLQIHHVPSEVFGPQQPSTHAVEGVWSCWDFIYIYIHIIIYLIIYIYFPFEITFF